MISKYRESSGLINYAAFCGNIDCVFSDTVDSLAVINNSKSNAVFSSEEKQLLVDLLSAIRT